MSADKRLVARFLARETMGVVMVAVALFWSSGDLGWWPAWALVAVTAGWVAGTAVVILQRDPALLKERLGPRKGAKRWDTAIMAVYGLGQLALYIVAGLDHRYGWSGSPNLAAQIVALLVVAGGYGLTVWATAANAYFSQIVRIQAERGHTVATGGPYRFVRHPAYTGSILTQLAIPVLLGSWWALGIGVLDAALMVVRTALEDRTLQAELAGYAEYARQVRSRLLPGIW